MTQNYFKSFLRIAALLIGLALCVFVFEVLRISDTIAAADGAPVEAGASSGFSVSLRETIINLDQKAGATEKGTKLSWPLLVLFPGLAAFCFFFYAATGLNLAARPASGIVGEVRWRTALFDPLLLPGKPIDSFIEVSASISRMNLSGVKKTEKKGRVIYDAPYKKSPHIVAVPFAIKKLPFGENLIVACDVKDEFPVFYLEAGDMLLSDRLQTPIVLTEEKPIVSGVVLGIGINARK